MESPDTSVALAADTAATVDIAATVDTAATIDTAAAVDTAATIDRLRELLTRIRREPEPASGWVMRQERTSPLDTRYVAR
jgi:hypothetical protein